MEKLNCVLLVDDDTTTNFLNESLLEEMNIARQLMVAQNGKEGLALVKRFYQEHGNPPQLILLDINMPVMDGFEFLEAYRGLGFGRKEAARIVMLTTSSNPKDLQKGKALGVSDFLSKPLTEDMINRILKKED